MWTPQGVEDVSMSKDKRRKKPSTSYEIFHQLFERIDETININPDIQSLQSTVALQRLNW
jgi:hypothetical protein